MSNLIALVCDRCGKALVPAPETIPRGWVQDNLGGDHTCSDCLTAFGDLDAFLHWLSGELYTRLKAKKACKPAEIFYDLWFDELWDKFEAAR